MFVHAFLFLLRKALHHGLSTAAVMSFLTEMLHFFSRQKCAKNGTFPLVVKDMLFFLIEAHK